MNGGDAKKNSPSKALEETRVLKFGGTCMNPARSRAMVIDRIIEEKEKGQAVVAVVSAMGREGDPYATDTLGALLPPETPELDRERDALLTCGEGIAASLLAAELNASGVRALSLRGIQLGLFTDGRFGEARVVAAAPEAIRRFAGQGAVVVAAGFQGVSADGSVTTLGRGGSDTAAVALAAALDADGVVFYKDVGGLFSADPRSVPAASHLARIPYDEAAHLAHAGVRALHPESAWLAEKNGLPIEIKSLSGEGETTVITSPNDLTQSKYQSSGLFAVTSVEGIAQVTVTPAPTAEWPEFPERLFQILAEKNISLDMIGLFHDQAHFTLPALHVRPAVDCADRLGCSVRARTACAKVSLLGGGIHGVPGIMSRIIGALARKGIPIYQSTDTYTVISVLVDQARCRDAVRALHREFGLDAADESRKELASRRSE